MSDPSGVSEPNRQPSPHKETLFSAKLNFSAVLVSAVIAFALVKASAFLPQSYYFTLTSLVGGERASPFIINTPFLLTTEELCKRAAEKNIDIGTICSVGDSDDEDEGKTTAAPQSRQELKNSPPKPADSVPVPEAKTSSSSAPQVETEDEKKIKQTQQLLEQIRLERKRQKESAQVRSLQSSEVPQRKNIIALLLRCLIPIIAGGIVAAIYRANLTIEAGIGAALAVVLLFWPVAYLWDELQIGDQ